MGSSLVHSLLEAHRLPSRRGAPPPREASEWDLVVDHVAFDQATGPLVLAALEPLGVSRVVPDVAFLCLGRAGIHPGFDHLDHVRRLTRDARRLGIHVARSGRGRLDPVYRERFAAPARLVVGAGAGVATAGAFGALALPASELETATLLAGRPFHVESPRVVTVRISGSLAPWVSGADLALELERRLQRVAAPRPMLEIGGRGVRDLGMVDRVAVAARCGGRRATAVLFPSDDVTRATLKALGREADWKPLESGIDETGKVDVDLDLEVIEPMIAPFDDTHGARTVRHAMGLEVGKVVLGTQASWADLARVARVLVGRRVAPAVEMVIAPGSRTVVETAVQAGVMTTLVEAGARIEENEIPAGVDSTAALARAGLCFGVPPAGLADRRTVWHQASPETCAASALAGRLSDPREIEAEFRREDEPESYVSADRMFLRPAPPDESVNTFPRSAAALAPGLRLERPLRGTVVIKLGERVAAGEILPFGARLEPRLADLVSLADHAFAAIDPGFVTRARAHRAAFVVAGGELGLGSTREQEALVLAELGVRAVLARSYDAGFRRRLVRAGVLPLRLRLESDERGIRLGDELEIPGIPDNLEVGKPLVVRNLTRGTQLTLAHDLDPREMRLVRAGGLIALARDEAAERI